MYCALDYRGGLSRLDFHFNFYLLLLSVSVRLSRRAGDCRPSRQRMRIIKREQRSRGGGGGKN